MIEPETFPQVELRHFDISHRHSSVLFSIPTQHATKCMSILGDLMHAHPACVECTQKSVRSHTTSSIRDHYRNVSFFKRADAWRRRDRLLFSFHASLARGASDPRTYVREHNARGSFHSSDMLHPLSHHLSSHDPRPVRVSITRFNRACRRKALWIMEHVPTRTVKRH